MAGPAPWRELEDPSIAGGSPRAPDDAVVRPTGGNPWTIVVAIVVAGVLAVGAFLLAASSPAGTVVLDDRSGSPEPSGVVAGGLVVEVEGAVVHPGLVRLASGSRVGDAIDAAGGYGPRVDAGRADRELNLAAFVQDGDRIVVPSRDEVAASTPGPAAAPGGGGSTGGGPLDLNSATGPQLEELPGIGPATAAKIIAAREEQRFTSVEDLRTRKVVGASVFEKIHELVTVR